jgi:pimeloyl-ACP methyl ester carboxylesterase
MHTAPVLVVEASDDSLSGWWDGKFTLAEFHERLKNVPNCTVKVVPDTGHMMHHDKPEELAGMVEVFVV